jgi:hypothetical protein
MKEGELSLPSWGTGPNPAGFSGDLVGCCRGYRGRRLWGSGLLGQWVAGGCRL